MSEHSYKPIDPAKLRTYSIRQRGHKASLDKLAGLTAPGATVSDWLASLPPMLGAAEFVAVADAVVAARQAGRPVVFAMGGHVVKVGCGPIVIDLIERGVITAVAMNGSTAIHDAEMALLGATSEEVAETIKDGSFGMVEETLEFFSAACAQAQAKSIGLGAAIGGLLHDRRAPHVQHSILSAARRAGIPATVHAALGTDTVHVGRVDGGQLGQATLYDFRLLCAVVADLAANEPGQPGGVWLNIGSAVVLPEVFLKAVAVARNLGADLDAMVTANFDMLKHYRPTVNVVQRPTSGGRGHTIIGHHEILLPLLRQTVIDRWKAGPDA